MLRTTVLAGGLVAVALAQAAIDCGSYPGTGASDHTRYIAPNGKNYDIHCHAISASNEWRYADDTTSLETCIAACQAGNVLPGCNYAGYYESTSKCALTVLSSSQQAATEYSPAYYSSALYVPTLNCIDGSSNGTVFTPPGSSQKYQILCNYQYGGVTLGPSKLADTFEQCVAFCDATQGCVDVVYSSAKYCWLKSSQTNGYASPNWWTAVKVAGSQPAPGTSLPQDPTCFENPYIVEL